MFGSRTSWSSGRYVSTFRFLKDMHIFRNLEHENSETESWRNTYRGVDLEKNRFVPGEFSCTNSPTSCTWRKVVDGYKRNIVSLPKHHIRISRVFAALMRPIVRNTECDPLVFTTPVVATHCFLQHLQVYQNPDDQGWKLMKLLSIPTKQFTKVFPYSYCSRRATIIPDKYQSLMKISGYSNSKVFRHGPFWSSWERTFWSSWEIAAVCYPWHGWSAVEDCPRPEAGSAPNIRQYNSGAWCERCLLITKTLESPQSL